MLSCQPKNLDEVAGFCHIIDSIANHSEEKSVSKQPDKSWEAQLEEGRQAFYENPLQSLRGKSDVFRQGFYRAQEGGYTHLVSFYTRAPATGAIVKTEFRTTADAVKRHRACLKRRGIKQVTVSKL